MALSPTLQRMVDDSAAKYQSAYASDVSTVHAHLARLGLEKATKRDLQKIVSALVSDA